MSLEKAGKRPILKGQEKGLSTSTHTCGSRQHEWITTERELFFKETLLFLRAGGGGGREKRCQSQSQFHPSIAGLCLCYRRNGIKIVPEREKASSSSLSHSPHHPQLRPHTRKREGILSPLFPPVSVPFSLYKNMQRKKESLFFRVFHCCHMVCVQ